MNAPMQTTSGMWDEVRFRYLADVRKGSLPTTDDQAGLNAEVVPYLTMEFLRGEINDPALVGLGPNALVASENDTLLLWDGSNAGEFLRAKRGIVSSTAALVIPKFVDPRFLYWACKSQEDTIKAETVGMGIPHVNGEFLANLRIQIPGPNQQRAIADYLDRETARLDELVKENVRLLDLVAEKRRALITRAVTRGLEPNVPFRDSGISWLGEIPAYWGTWKVGHLAEVGNGSTPSRSNAAYWSEGKIPWLNSSVVNRSEVTHADQFVTALATQECHLPLVKRGSVLVAITGQGKTRGRAAVLSLDATINQHLAFIHPKQSRLLPWFLKWTLFAAYDHLRCISDDVGGTKGALTCEEVANLRVPVPPVREQAVILAKIAASVERLDSLQAVAKNTISLIEERRAALISAAVTGEIDMEQVA